MGIRYKKIEGTARSLAGLSIAAALLFHATLVSAHHDTEPPPITEFEPMEVVGEPATDLLGQIDSASAGYVSQAEFEFRPVLRAGELVEVIPGMLATQHSGTGKANQYFLRGFNLDHGTDFSASIDGVPLNLPSHGHGQGYLDLNSIIPELIDVVEYGKGPYHSEVGDFSSAGHARFHSVHKLDKGFFKFTGGHYDYYRSVLANSMRFGDADFLFGAEMNLYEGPWQKDESLNKFNGLARLTVDRGNWGYAWIGTAYRSTWDSTDQIPRRAVENGVLSRRGTVDPSDGGDMQRYSLAGNWWRQGNDAESEITVYAVYADLNLYSNFSFFLQDPLNGDQIKQKDRRLIAGGEGSHRWFDSWFNRDVVNTIGLQVRHDYVPAVALFRSRARNILSTVSDHRVNETTLGVYLENEVRWLEKFKTVAGLRGDFFFFDVTSRNLPANSGRVHDELFSPKLSFVFGPWYDTEYFLNLGYGFHSNDARGTVIRTDPVNGEPATPVDPLVRSRGAEAGIRTQWVPGLVSALAVWWLELDSELVFVGDAGTTEPSGKSRRFGVEWTSDYKPTDWLTLDVDLAFSRSRFADAPSDQNRVPNSVGRTVSAGATVNLPNGFFGAIRLRHFGDVPLTEDGRVEAGSTTMVNLGVGYQRTDFRLELNVFNLLDSRDNDIAYFYASRLAGEPALGIEDVHFHPVEPRSVRLQAVVPF